MKGTFPTGYAIGIFSCYLGNKYFTYSHTDSRYTNIYFLLFYIQDSRFYDVVKKIFPFSDLRFYDRVKSRIKYFTVV